MASLERALEEWKGRAKRALVVIDAGVSCEDPASVEEGFEPCCAPEHQPTLQERAWTSPIWFDPEGQRPR